MPTLEQATRPSLCVTVAAATYRQTAAAQHLATCLQLDLVAQGEAPPGYLLLLCEARLALHSTLSPPLHGPVFVDFVTGKSAHRRAFGGGRGQHMARAVGIKPGYNPTIIDATAGLGRDAFVLATLGCKVIMIEQSPVVARLLEDGLSRAHTTEETHAIALRMQLNCGNALEVIPVLVDRSTRTDRPKPDVIYLDPMYPPRDKSAAVKKEMQMLQMLAEKNTDNAELLACALQHAGKRVVVKRPRTAAALAGKTPHACIKNTNTRYDIYIPMG